MRRKQLRSRRRGQQMVEVIILVALVGLALAWVVKEFPKGITKHYENNRDVIASPL